MDTKALDSAAKFSAALAGVALAAPQASGAIVGLNFTPNPVTYGPTQTVSITDTLAAPVAQFQQFNNSDGKTLSADLPPISGFAYITVGQPITTGATFFSLISIGATVGDTGTFAFLTATNNVGWIRVNFGGAGGPVTYLAGAWNNTPGGAIISGGGAVGAVPETSTTIALAGLATLAAGVGIRKARRRKMKSVSAS
ncbi:MAG: hypothetical protein AAFX93_16085 [Verrucomicrobiota bacterium]